MKLIYTIFVILLLLICKNAYAEINLEYKIIGVPENIEKNIRQQLISSQTLHHKALTEPSIKAFFKEQAPIVVINAVEPFGYFKAKIIFKQLKKIASDKWLAQFTIKLGPVLKITKLDIKISGPGSQNKEFQSLMQNLPLQQSDPLDMNKYNKIKFDLTNLAAEKGFLGAKLTQHKIYIDKENYTSSIILHFETGPQYYFGPVKFNDKFYSDEFLQRFVQFKPGDNYSPDALLKLQQDLSGTIYFSQVSIEPVDENANNLAIPILVSTELTKSQSYNFGLGYGTDTGIRGTADAEWRHLTPSGHHFKAFLQASQVQSSAMARYIIPGKNPLTDQYYFGASLEQQDINNSKGTTESLTAGKTDRFYGWQRTVALSYQWDQYSLNREPFEKTHLLLPSITFMKSKIDDPVFPRHGRRISIDLLGTAKPLISSSTFLQTELDVKYIFSPTDSSRLLLRGDVGITVADDIEKVPLSLQFFAGGSNSIRGYRYEELGPGRYLIVGSAEFQHQVYNNWWGAVFVDAGNAVNSLTNPGGATIGRPPGGIKLSQILKYSTGLGVIYVSPVGPIEVTLAKSITDTTQPIRLQFTMGTTL